jgi:Ca2+-binding EF-hand superfamily protein
MNKYLNTNQLNLNKVTVNELKNLLQLIDTHDGKINYTQFLASTISEQSLAAK